MQWFFSPVTLGGVAAGGQCVMPRRRYNPVCDNDRRRIIDAFTDGEDYVECAERLGARRSTANSIVRRHQDTGSIATVDRRKGGRPGKMDGEMRDFILQLVEEAPTITLKEMNNIMRATWPHKQHVSTTTIARALSGMLVSVKLCHDIPTDRNRADIIQHRKR